MLLVWVVFFFTFHGTLSTTQYFVRENKVMSRNLNYSKSRARTVQCSSWAFLAEKKTLFFV